jgi:septum formation protein
MSLNIPPIILASASAARRRILQTIGIEPIIEVSDFDEDSIQHADPEQLVQALAIAKAQTVAARLRYDHCLVLGCDSVLWVNGQIQGKPPNAATAIQRWQAMRGTVGAIYTGHATIVSKSSELSCAVVSPKFTLLKLMIGKLPPMLLLVSHSNVPEALP